MSTAPENETLLLSGNEAVAQAFRDAEICLGTGYPGTPSTEILENFSLLGGRAQWAPNEKVALEVAIGAAFAGGRAACTMKHVGLNVAADPLFTAAYTGVTGALVLAVADDPGMASSQNEQDSRRYAVAAGLPMLEPADSQQAYDFTQRAVQLSEHWQLPVLLRLTTRISHSKTLVRRRNIAGPAPAPHFERDIPTRVMVPAFARPAHVRLREKLGAIPAWADAELDVQLETEGTRELGIIATSVAAVHAREAAPDASLFQPGLSYPPPLDRLKAFAEKHERCVVIEEGDPVLFEALRAAGAPVEGKAERFRFGELNVGRVRRILAGDDSPEPQPVKGKPPALCKGCPHRIAFTLLGELECIVSGDIGCYTLGVLPPFNAMDSCVCMGASIGVGLGLRHALPPDQARRVVSVIGDSTFMHSGLTGLAEMVYNPPETGHVVLILDNSTTAMTGLQEHPGTGRKLDHTPAARIDYAEVGRALGIENVVQMDPLREGADALRERLTTALDSGGLWLFVLQRPCLLAAGKIKAYDKQNAEQCNAVAVE